MAKKHFEKLCKDLKKVSGIDLAADAEYKNNGFETDLHVVESEKGGSVAVRTQNGHKHVTGFIFAGFALEHGFKHEGGRYVYTGEEEEADDKAERDSGKGS